MDVVVFVGMYACVYHVMDEDSPQQGSGTAVDGLMVMMEALGFLKEAWKSAVKSVVV